MLQKKIRTVYMRGGTSKGLFFLKDWLPADPVQREKTLLRVIGSPDPYEKQIDGMGGATSSTSKVVIVSPSQRPDCDVDYQFGQVAVDRPVIDWSGNCGNLTAGVGAFAISQGLVPCPADGVAVVRIWQTNIQARIIAHVPVSGGEVLEEGDFNLDGVAFPSAEIKLEYLEPCGAEESSSAMFPTGSAVDPCDVPGFGPVEMTMINAGNPTVFINAEALGLSGTELQPGVNGNTDLLSKVETLRAYAAVKMGLAASAEDATQNRPHTPKLAVLARPAPYTSSGGKEMLPDQLDLNARIFSMGKLHHAFTGTGAIALAVAASLPGTLAERMVNQVQGHPLRIGHPSGCVEVGAVVEKRGSDWFVTKALMSRSARRIMEGYVFMPLA